MDSLAARELSIAGCNGVFYVCLFLLTEGPRYHGVL